MAHAGHDAPAIWPRACRVKDVVGCMLMAHVGLAYPVKRVEESGATVGLRETSLSRLADSGHAAWEIRWLGFGERAAED
jgi:hypothetical protein